MHALFRRGPFDGVGRVVERADPELRFPQLARIPWSFNGADLPGPHDEVATRQVVYRRRAIDGRHAIYDFAGIV